MKNDSALSANGHYLCIFICGLTDRLCLKYFAGLKDSKDFINVVDSEDGDTPLHSAAYYGHLDILKFLLPLSENPNYRNKIGETPIDTARKKQHGNVVKFLENYNKKQ